MLLTKLKLKKTIKCFEKVYTIISFMCGCRGDGGVPEWAAGDLGESAVQARALPVHPEASQRLRGSFPAAAPGRRQRHRQGRHLLHR